MPFHSTGPHYCPACPTVVNKRGRTMNEPLRLLESNYSGCGVDMASCPECGKVWEISYKVDRMTRAKSWEAKTE